MAPYMQGLKSQFNASLFSKMGLQRIIALSILFFTLLCHAEPSGGPYSRLAQCKATVNKPEPTGNSTAGDTHKIVQFRIPIKEEPRMAFCTLAFMQDVALSCDGEDIKDVVVSEPVIEDGDCRAVFDIVSNLPNERAAEHECLVKSLNCVLDIFELKRILECVRLLHDCMVT